MGDGFQFLDIILLAMVAAFIFLRLRGVLGKRTGHEQTPQDKNEDRYDDDDEKQDDDNVIQLGDRSDDVSEAAYDGDPIDRLVSSIKMLDQSFDKTVFLERAVSAYEYIVSAFARGDRGSLKGLLADDVFENFEKSISDRESAGYTMSTDIVSIKEPFLVDGEILGKIAELTVKFETEMISHTEDEDGELITGDTNPRTVTEFWTFSRNMKSRDPNWQLITTKSES